MTSLNSREDADQAAQRLAEIDERYRRVRLLNDQILKLLNALGNNLEGAIGSRRKLWIQMIPALVSSRKRNQLRQLPEALSELRNFVGRPNLSVWNPLVIAMEKGSSELRAPRSEWKQLFLAIDVALDNVEKAVDQRRDGLAALIAKYGGLPGFNRVRYADRMILDSRNSSETGSAEAESSPRSARKLASFLIPANRQDEVIGDIAELYHREWLPLLGPNGARWCSIWNVITASVALRRIAITAAVVDGFCRILGR